MWAFLSHPLTVTLFGVAITGVLVPYFARRWQNKQKALEVQVGLVADISESAMGLMARVQAVHKLRKLTHASGFSEGQQGKLLEELDHAQDRLNTERQEFEVREAVIGTKLEANFGRSDVPKRWTSLAQALIELVDLEGSGNSPADIERRFALIDRLQKLDPTPVDNQSWPTLFDAAAKRKAVLIKEVLHAPWIFRTSSIPWRW